MRSISAAQSKGDIWRFFKGKSSPIERRRMEESAPCTMSRLLMCPSSPIANKTAAWSTSSTWLLATGFVCGNSEYCIRVSRYPAGCRPSKTMTQVVDNASFARADSKRPCYILAHRPKRFVKVFKARDKIDTYGPLAQLVEHLICNEGVAGSNPVRSTKTENRLKAGFLLVRP